MRKELANFHYVKVLCEISGLQPSWWRWYSSKGYETPLVCLSIQTSCISGHSQGERRVEWVITAWFCILLMKLQNTAREHFPCPPSSSCWTIVLGSALSLFTSYLKDHTYRVIWRESVSEPCSLTAGASQGSVLGLLLFHFLFWVMWLHYPLTQFFLPHLCRWHLTNPVLPGGSPNLCVSGWHLSVDVCTPPEAQPR